ncbi:hypothetical protein EKO04_003510 [Ascochyta lentis]|uniref:Cyanovirin-N domain-containing protein n=1 Tax=Ascochyta lentis TaxID=205686 RepID=A0A8H7J8G2_9PLEO|nr:hypothetical protein EKO04_003510 [Ascochyta lentis]
MFNLKLFMLAVAAAGLSYAAPTAGSLSLSSSCSNVNFSNNLLVADCLTAADGSTRITSSISLNDKITNDQGTMRWSSTGNFLSTCTACRVQPQLELNCYCKFPGGDSFQSLINLQDHIFSKAGSLVSDL